TKEKLASRTKEVVGTGGGTATQPQTTSLDEGIENTYGTGAVTMRISKVASWPLHHDVTGIRCQEEFWDLDQRLVGKDTSKQVQEEHGCSANQCRGQRNFERLKKEVCRCINDK
ncbi:hypothetical protein NDU88_006076, partial [Pleurodeles waltl]